MHSRTKTVVLLALLSGFAASCGLTTRSVADIREHPAHYYHHSVSIEGTVTSSFGGPFVPLQVYNVDDGTGEITVVANSSREVPRKGARVRVKGHVEDVASFANRSIGLHLAQEHLTVRPR
jgi:hypothetical protein